MTADVGRTAQDISEDLLSLATQGLLSCEFSKFEPCFAIPCLFESFDAKRNVGTNAELEAFFLKICKRCAVIGVNDIAPHCVQASFHGEDKITFLYETRLLHGTQLLHDPYPSYSEARRIDGAWRVVQCSYAVDSTSEITRLFEF
ncbi:hypothetical protein E4Z66_18885 [Aliishimia ponticola]|uniref:SnoaL-like domain-containing protein n=1 Tax=Aliishimia ponticola TaxID=2499833 RepID=A0A4S4N7I0_9RHOB|nr:hypothetical protein [Aliishimia ponticola]THH34495.1 hypothetical protein E4Z66_18885 [Aliishimia ponticola]